jgi:hypothetical protein
MSITPELLQQLLPSAIKWARDGEDFIMKHGREPEPAEESDATLAGVRFPNKIRVCVVPHIPRPVDGALGQANQAIGLVTDRTGGLTLNYGIFIRQDCAGDAALLFHEFVHVGQYERLGDFEGFLPKYLDECVRFGYPNAPLECEAVESTTRRKKS